MEVKIKTNNEMIDATIEMIDGVMVVSPKKVEEVDITQFKDGDIITCGWNTGDKSYNWISILRGEIERITDNMFIADYCTLNCDGTYSFENGDSDSATYVRYATEEEKKLLLDKLAEEGYEWLADEKKLVKKKWISNEFESFYRPTCTFGRFESYFDEKRSVESNAYMDKGWIFRTKEECQKFCDKLNNAINSIKP